MNARSTEIRNFFTVQFAEPSCGLKRAGLGCKDNINCSY